ncbi:hypothetical protein Tco_0507523 [Tanacetum coccineum]
MIIVGIVLLWQNFLELLIDSLEDNSPCISIELITLKPHSKAINKVLLAFNSALLCAFSSALEGIAVSYHQTVFVTMGALTSFYAPIECNQCTIGTAPSSSSRDHTHQVLRIQTLTSSDTLVEPIE